MPPNPVVLPVDLKDLEMAAKARLTHEAYDYYAGGADDELTLRENERAFQDIFLSPRVLIDVATVETRLTLLGSPLDTPVLLAPAAFQRLASPGGELDTSRAAGSSGSLLVASSLATTSIEAMAAVATGPLWLQLYVFRDRSISEELVRRAAASGVRAICLTVTVPVQGNRRRDAHNRFSLPEDLEMANFTGLPQERFPDASGSALGEFISAQFDPSLTWETLEWLHSVSDLPVVVKGILREDDAALAVQHGAAGIVVSNHGGRQLDGAVPTAVALPEVVSGAGGKVPVLIDGGIRRGSDVLKALALGATAVMVARPYLWGLAVAGQQGVEHVIDLLTSELRRTMALLGVTSLDGIDQSVLSRWKPR